MRKWRRIKGGYDLRLLRMEGFRGSTTRRANIRSYLHETRSSDPPCMDPYLYLHIALGRTYYIIRIPPNLSTCLYFIPCLFSPGPSNTIVYRFHLNNPHPPFNVSSPPMGFGTANGVDPDCAPPPPPVAPAFPFA